MSSCKNQMIFIWNVLSLSIFQKQKSAQQLNSFTAIHGPQDGQQKASRELYTREVKESRKSFSQWCAAKDTKSWWRLKRDPPKPKPNGLGNPKWRHKMLIGDTWKENILISFDIYWSMFDFGGIMLYCIGIASCNKCKMWK